MTLSEMLLPEFEQEMKYTRSVIERVPEAKFDWRPHDKSYTMHDLMVHVSNLPTWGEITLNRDSFDMAPVDGGPVRAAPVNSVEEALARFDENVQRTRAALEEASDATFKKPWTLLASGHEIFTLPRLPVFRSFFMNHLIHHRAQLGVYLRLCDVPLPQIYGPTADEPS